MMVKLAARGAMTDDCNHCRRNATYRNHGMESTTFLTI